MADKPKYSSIIDEFLDEREPDWKDLGLKDAKNSGDEWLDRTHSEADESFLDDIAEGASKHTNVPPTSKGATLQNRIIEKESANPRLGANRGAQTRTAGGADDDESLVAEVTESIEDAAKNGKVEKRNRSDSEIQRYVHQLLNQGVSPAKVATKLKQLSEIESFNPHAASEFLQKHAGLLGIAYMEPQKKVAELELYNKTNNMSNSYLNNSEAGGTGADVLEPNTFMEGQNPAYNHTAAGFNSQSEFEALKQQGGIMSQIRAGDIVTILVPNGTKRGPNGGTVPDYSAGKTQRGRAVMYGPAGWVLNLGGRHGTPGIANEENIVKVRKAKSGSEEVSSKDCVRQATAWKAAGITPRAKSVKQISACEGCSYFSKNGSDKTCSLYHLPVVGSESELSKVVNRMTAGVPAGSKKAALVQIANQTGERVIAHTAAKKPEPAVHTSSYTHERPKGFAEPQHFGAVQVMKLHAAGHSLKAIMAAGEKKFGAIETSKAVRDFIAGLRKEKGKIVMAKADADYLKKIGIHNDAIVGAAKCAACKTHTAKCSKFVPTYEGGRPGNNDGRPILCHGCGKTEDKCEGSKNNKKAAEGVTRVPDTFVASTPDRVRAANHTVAASFDSASVAKLHTAGHAVDKIYKAASAKYGSVQATKAIREWAHGLKNTNTKIALSQIDCTVLDKMGVKLSSKNAIVGAEKCGSCSFRNGMHCGLTGGTLLSFPGMNQVASNKKVAAGAPEDGRSILKEFDLMGSAPQADIDMKAPDRAEVEMSSKPDAGEI